MTSFALEPIYGSLLFALLIGVATVAVILMVTPPTENATHRRVLISLRLIAAGVLLLAAFRPALLRTDNRPADAALVVAVDTSRSMTLPDGDGETRWRTQKQAWERLAQGILGLDQSLSVRLIAYDSLARNVPSVSNGSLDDLSPDGELTDLSAAAVASMQAAEGQPIAGIVMMGDGTQTAPLKGAGAQRVVETLSSLGVPLWTVPIGPAGGASASRDVAVDSLQESYRLFAGNKVEINFQVAARGLAGVEVPVRLSWVDASGKTIEVASRSFVPGQSSDLQALSVPITAPEPGTYRLKVEADPQDGELVTANNLQVAFVDVREGGGRILYLEGQTREEQAFLRRSLRRSPDFDLTYQWIPEDTSATWPVDLRDWLEPGKFDVYIIGDLDSAAIGSKQLAQLAETVSAGAGLVTLGGYQTYRAGGYDTSPLADALPVRMSGETGDEIAGPLTIRLARNHPITDLGGDDPASIWQQLPPLLGANRLSGPKIAPGVFVLLETPEKQPLLVAGEYGSGRTAALAIDSTYRWWRAGKRDVHRRFWRQLILWLLAREEASGDKIVIEMDARRFATNQPPEFRASVDSPNIDPSSVDPSRATSTAVPLVAEIVSDSGEVVAVQTTTETRGEESTASVLTVIRGKVPDLEAGFYRLRVRPAESSGTLAPEEMAFQVIDESRELAQPMADPVYLRQLADLTAEHGGAAFVPDDVDELVETIKNRRRKAETPVVEKFRLGDGPISGWILFAIFVGMMSTEWFLRRNWGLA